MKEETAEDQGDVITPGCILKGVQHSTFYNKADDNNDDTMFANDDMIITRGCALAQGSDFNNKLENEPAGGVVSVRYKNKTEMQDSAPSSSPSLYPTVSPSVHPTKRPTQYPTNAPSHSPTKEQLLPNR